MRQRPGKSPFCNIFEATYQGELISLAKRVRPKRKRARIDTMTLYRCATKLDVQSPIGNTVYLMLVEKSRMMLGECAGQVDLVRDEVQSHRPPDLMERAQRYSLDRTTTARPYGGRTSSGGWRAEAGRPIGSKNTPNGMRDLSDSLKE
jgi:hypothetical protein